MKSVLLVGSGHVGSRLLSVCKKNRLHVYITSRNPQKISSFQSDTVTPIPYDALAVDRPAFPSCDATFITLAPDARTKENYQLTYITALSNVLQDLKNNSDDHRVLYTSSIGVYSESEGNWVEESTPPNPKTDRQKILIEAETLVGSTSHKNIILRLSGIYSETRNRLKEYLDPKLEELGDFEKYINLIHVDDAARMLFFLSQVPNPHHLYVGTDTLPVKKGELVNWLRSRAQLALCQPAPTANKTNHKRASSSRINSMGFQFTYPTYQEGYNNLIT